MMRYASDLKRNHETAGGSTDRCMGYSPNGNPPNDDPVGITFTHDEVDAILNSNAAALLGLNRRV